MNVSKFSSLFLVVASSTLFGYESGYRVGLGVFFGLVALIIEMPRKD